LSQVKLVRPDRRDSLGRCEGDRDHDVEYRDGLFFYLRRHTFENVPGCAEGDRGPSQQKSRDFSIYKKETIFQIEILTEDLAKATKENTSMKKELEQIRSERDEQARNEGRKMILHNGIKAIIQSDDNE
jgi:hypothetical protein